MQDPEDMVKPCEMLSLEHDMAMVSQNLWLPALSLHKTGPIYS